MLALVIFALIFGVFPVNSWFNNQFMIDVDPFDEQCFFEYVHSGTRINLRLQVVEGGFLDIVFKEKFPNGTEIQQDTTGLINFHEFKESGTYEFCLNNEMSTLTPKTIRIIYYILHEEEFKEMFVLREGNSTVEALIETLSDKFHAFAFDSYFLESMQDLHHTLNERTNKWVLWWAILEGLMILALTLGQVYYIKRYFEVKRLV